MESFQQKPPIHEILTKFAQFFLDLKLITSDVLSVLMERELCAPESLAKMSSVCRMVCQAFCGLLKVAKAPSECQPDRSR